MNSEPMISDRFYREKEPMNDLTTRDPTPMSLLSAAVERGVDADQLGKLLDLQERYENNEARKAYAVAMHAAQSEMPRVVKGAKNEQTKSRYANLEQVQHTAGPIYHKHGFSLSYGEEDCPQDGYKRTICDVRHESGHCERYHLDLPVDGFSAKGNPIGSMNPVQASISTTSYGQRRLLCMVFNITITDEDDDGQGSAVISDDQVATIRQWIKTTSSDEAAFLKWAGAESVETMQAARFAPAVAHFRRKAGEGVKP